MRQKRSVLMIAIKSSFSWRWTGTKRLLFHAWVCGAAAGLSQAITPPEPGYLGGSSRLTQVAQIRNLPRDETACEYPVRIRGAVTYYQGRKGDTFVFVQASTRGIFVEIKGKIPPLDAGHFVDLEGSSSPGDYAPIIRDPHFRPLERSPLTPGRHCPRYDQAEEDGASATRKRRAVPPAGGKHIGSLLCQGAGPGAADLPQSRLSRGVGPLTAGYL